MDPEVALWTLGSEPQSCTFFRLFVELLGLIMDPDDWGGVA